MNLNNMLGARLFKYNEDTLEVYKVISYINESEVRVKNINTNEMKRLKYSDIEKEGFNILNPDGYITFNIVDIGNDKQDIIVSMHRARDMEEGYKPYCVARQAVINIYNEIIKGVDNFTNVGMTMSIDTVPEGVDFNIMLACESVKLFTSIAYYIDDKLDDILECITSRNMKKYDQVLEDLFMDNYNKLTDYIKAVDKVLEKDIYYGFCRNLRTFLNYHEFMYDVRHGFGVAYIDKHFTISEDMYVPSQEVIGWLEESYGFKIYNPIIYKFSKDINLSQINKNYILCMFKDENLYICTYDSSDDIMESIHENESLSVSDKIANLNKLQL